MFRKSLHEYIFAQQSNDDIYSKYREHKTRMYQSVNEATITKEIEADREIVYTPLSSISFMYSLASKSFRTPLIFSVGG